jgi:hypothetical protein
MDYLNIFENFQEKSIPSIIKKISYIIRKDIINNGNNNFDKIYNIDNININLIIDYRKTEKQPYYSNVNIYDIISGNEPINIKVLVRDISIDINYLMSVISHEIRHVYDIYTISDDIEIKDFQKSLIVSKFKGHNDFINLVYLSLEHELIARHNMLYELFRWIEITDKNELYNIFKKSYTYTSLNYLKDFNHVNFINRTTNLKDFTLNFSKSINDKFDGNLLEYYKKWETFFHNKYNEFMSYIDNMLDDVIYDIENDKIYERMCGFISYNENISNKVSYKTFNKMINELNKNYENR